MNAYIDKLRKRWEECSFFDDPPPTPSTPPDITPSTTTMVPTVSSINEFYKICIHKNSPAIVLNSNDSFANLEKFIIIKNDDKIDHQSIIDKLHKDTKVPVKVSSNESILDNEGRAYEESTIKDVTLDEFVNSRMNDDPSVYLKDWHFVNETNNEGVYSVPEEFSRDLLTPFLLEFDGSDYRFLYWGAKESQTGLHTDVLGSYSWSYNVCGKKLWTFIHPESCEVSERSE